MLKPVFDLVKANSATKPNVWATVSKHYDSLSNKATGDTVSYTNGKVAYKALNWGSPLVLFKDSFLWPVRDAGRAQSFPER